MKDACLNCQLPICDDKDARCAFVQITRQDRKQYFADYYQANRDKKLAAANARHQAKRGLGLNDPATATQAR